MTRMKKWRNKRDLVEQMNENMSISDRYKMKFQKLKYIPKNAKGVKCIQGQGKLSY